jgi:hypothetical protein
VYALQGATNIKFMWTCCVLFTILGNKPCNIFGNYYAVWQMATGLHQRHGHWTLVCLLLLDFRPLQPSLTNASRNTWKCTPRCTVVSKKGRDVIVCVFVVVWLVCVVAGAGHSLSQHTRTNNCSNTGKAVAQHSSQPAHHIRQGQVADIEKWHPHHIW